MSLDCSLFICCRKWYAIEHVATGRNASLQKYSYKRTKIICMKKLFSLIIISIAVSSLLAQKNSIPHLEKNGTVTQLIVQGKPFLVLGGELHNSSTSGAAYMQPIWAQMKKK